MGAPVPHTCPLIDSIKEDVTNAEKSAINIVNILDGVDFDQDDIENIIKDVLAEAKEIESSLWRTDSEIEEVRDANSQLRNWGEELEYELEEKED